MKSDLFILNLQCGEAGLQLLTPLEQLAFQGLLRTHHSHLCPQARKRVTIFKSAIKRKPKMFQKNRTCTVSPIWDWKSKRAGGQKTLL